MNHFQRAVAQHLLSEARDLQQATCIPTLDKDRLSVALKYANALAADLTSSNLLTNYTNGNENPSLEGLQHFVKELWRIDPDWMDVVDRSPRSLEEMIAGITPENLHGEVDFGRPVGREIV